MQRLHVFIIILITTIGVLVSLATVAWYLSVTAPSYYGSSWMSQMWGNHLGASGNYGGMGGMMGNGSSGTSTTSYLWIVPVLLIIASVVAVIGVVFYLVFPELRYIRNRGSCNPQEPRPTTTQTAGSISTTANISPASVAPAVSSVSTAPNNCEVLLKTMTSEEQKVLNVLINHQGKYLQKYVVKETGLSRLKTHRVIARFAQRGIVTVNEFGNTNEILLSDWVKDPSTPK